MNEEVELFDPDSSPSAWEFYRKVYTRQHFSLISDFNLNELKRARGTNEYTRLLAFIKLKSPLAAEDVMRYMEIACEYWKIREVKFLKK